MASPPSSVAGKSHFKPTVNLYDWWLVKSEDDGEKQRLGVAGVSSIERVIPRRVFHSASISKKYDIFTLETSDGVTIILRGLINKEQTVANGFPDEVATRFRLGFPMGWEKCVEGFLGRGSNTTAEKDTTQFSPTSDAGQVVPGVSAIYNRIFAGRGPRDSSIFTRSKEKMKQFVVCKLKSKQKTKDSVPAVETVSTTLQNDVCEVGVCGLNSEEHSKDTVPADGTVSNTLGNGDCEVGGRSLFESFLSYCGMAAGVISSSLTSDFAQESFHEDRLGVEDPTRLCTQFSSKSTIDDAIVDDPMNGDTEEEPDQENFWSTDSQYIGSPLNVEENEKDQASLCSVKLKSTKSSSASEAIENLDGSPDASPQSGREKDTLERSPSHFAGRVSKLLSGISRRTGKNKQVVANDLNSETNTLDSIPVVSEIVGNTSHNDSCLAGGNDMFHPDSELQDPVDMDVVRKPDFDFVEDDMQHTSYGKEGHDCGNPTAEVGEGESGAKEEITYRTGKKRTKTIDTQETHLTRESSKKKKFGPSTLKVSKDKKISPSTFKVSKGEKVSSSNLEVNKRKNKTPCTAEVKKRKRATPSPAPATPKVNKREKETASAVEVKKRKNATPSTAVTTPKVKKETTLWSLATPTVNKIIVSPESRSTGRSRSGRLHLPPLEFWRNQKAIYDVDRGITGIQEELL